MKEKITIAIRILLGVLLLMSGINKFVGFMEFPEMPEKAEALMNAFMAAGYILKIVGIVEIITGLLLLINRLVPLALILLAPVAVNIILFHLFLDIKSIAPGLFIFVVMGYLMHQHKSAYDLILKA